MSSTASSLPEISVARHFVPSLFSGVKSLDTGLAFRVHRTPADDDLIGADTHVVGHRKRVTVLELVIENRNPLPEP